MKTPLSRKAKKNGEWPQKVEFGRVTVSVYRRETPGGIPCFMVANYSGPKRRFDSYPSETKALEEARKLARKLSERDTLGAAMTQGQALEYAGAVQALAPFNVSVGAGAAALAECLKTVRDLPNLHAAVKFYAARFKTITPKRVAEVVAELLDVKEARGASARYLGDLKSRLGLFAEAFQKNASDVTPAEIQAWLDGVKQSSQTYTNNRRVVHLFFEFCSARGYSAENPAKAVEKIKVRNSEVAIFTPKELASLLSSASPDFLPCLALGAFAGLRSAEVERLDWADIKLDAKSVVVGASRAKTAARRVVPMPDCLCEWLAPYAGRQGQIWAGGHDAFYEAQQDTASNAGINWKANALRHSFASYRFAQTGDAGRVAGELGNSASVVHKHYRELVDPSTAAQYFDIKPAQAKNVVAMPTNAAA